MQILLCARLRALHLQYIEEPTSSWEDSLRFYQETGVPIALDETLDAAMQAPQVPYAHTCLSALPARFVKYGLLFYNRKSIIYAWTRY